MKEQQTQGEENKIMKTSTNYNLYFLIFSIINFFVLIFSFILFLVFFFSPNSLQGNNINEFSNDYCNDTKNEYYDFLCTNKYYKNKIKKSKFIWILTDGTAADETLLLTNYEKYKITTSFLVNGDDMTYKHTNEMYETLITGKHNRNFIGKEIGYDNIIQQLVNSGYKINYRGWDLPIPRIVGDTKNGKKENKIFNKKYIDDNHEILAFSSFCNITNPFPFIKVSYDDYQNPTPNNNVDDDLLEKIKIIINAFGNHIYSKENKLQLYDKLDKLFKKYPIDLFTISIDDCLKKSFDWNEKDNISILFYTTEVDHYNHLFGRNHIYTVLQMYITEKMIERIMEWIDNHDDYALIVTADHGGQAFYGEDSLRNHGEDYDGNEAIFFIYTKELKDNYDTLKMRERHIYMTEESTIIPQILLNISIPINSRGFPQQIIDDDINNFISLKMKEIQLIKLIERYIEKYKNYEKSLKDILNELKSNFTFIQTVINEYIADDLHIYTQKEESFKKLLLIYQNSLKKRQEEIIKIINKKNKSAGNIILFILLFIIIFIKFCFENHFLFFKILNTDKADVSSGKNRKWYFLNIFVFQFFYIFWFYGSIANIDLNIGIIVYCFYYGYYISIVLFHLIFNILRLDWKKNKTKIVFLVGSVFCFTVLSQNLSYSDCFYYLKRNFTYFSKLSLIGIDLFSFYIFLLFYIAREMFRYHEKKYFISFCKKKIYLSSLYFVYFAYIITLFIEDCTKKDCYEQNMGNRVFVWFNFIFFIFFWIESHFTVYEERTKTEERIVNVDINNLENNENDLQSKDAVLNKNKNIGNSENMNIRNAEQKFLNDIKVQGLPQIKLFLVLLYSWVSEETQKLYGLIIFLPFLEIFNYLSNDYHSKLNDIIYKNKNFNLEEVRSEDSSNTNVNNEIQNEEKKNKKQHNYYLFYFFFYITMQDMFLVANQSAFALMKYSYGLETDSPQKNKFVYVLKFLKVVLLNVSKYKYMFIVLGFFLEKGIYDKYNNQQYSLDFLIRKIILAFRINLDLIYFFYIMLVEVNDQIFIDLFVYCIANISLFVLDYIGFGFTKLGMKICK